MFCHDEAELWILFKGFENIFIVAVSKFVYGLFDRIIDRLYPRTEKYFQNELKKQVKRHFDAIHMLKELQNRQQLPEFKDDTNIAFEISQAKHDVDFSEFTIEQLVKSMKGLGYKIPKELYDDYPFLIELVKK